MSGMRDRRKQVQKKGEVNGSENGKAGGTVSVRKIA